MLSLRPLVPAIAKCNAAAMKLSLAAILLSVVPHALAADQAPADWPFSGHDIHNTRNAAGESTLDPSRVAGLTPLWTLTTDGNVTATPAVVDGVVYAPDFGGSLWAVDAATGRVIWKSAIGDLTGVKGDVSRTTPAFLGGSLILGEGTQTVSALEGASMLAVDAKSGRRLWLTKVEDNPVAIITSAPVADDGVVYVGTSSKAETINRPTGFRGSVVALSAETGKVLWKTYLTPEGYTGAAAWGSTPVVDRDTGLLYVATGNNYSVPEGVCRAPDATGCTPSAPDNYVESIVALDLKTGRIAWATPTLPADVSTNFDHEDGPDYDFAQGPILFTTELGGRSAAVLGVGQKSGVYWALDPATGRVLWKTEVGPGSRLGGMMWGSATDGKRIYVSIGNAAHRPVTATFADGQSRTITGGFWAALDPATGAVLWRAPDPQGAPDVGALTVADGVVYAGSLAPHGNNMYAIDAATGDFRWAFASGGSVAGGAAVVNGAVYWGSGYKIGPISGPNDKLYAFSAPEN
jgi:polyvinyl alcohol dehydrogenase (cytochrome)